MVQPAQTMKHHTRHGTSPPALLFYPNRPFLSSGFRTIQRISIDLFPSCRQWQDDGGIEHAEKERRLHSDAPSPIKTVCPNIQSVLPKPTDTQPTAPGVVQTLFERGVSGREHFADRAKGSFPGWPGAIKRKRPIYAATVSQPTIRNQDGSYLSSPTEPPFGRGWEGALGSIPRPASFPVTPAQPPPDGPCRPRRLAAHCPRWPDRRP